MAEKAYASADQQFNWHQNQSARRRGAVRYVAACVGLMLAIGVAAVVVVARVQRAPGRELRVASGSMQPTLAIGQVVHVDTAAYSSAVPQIGDIVAFNAPVGATGEAPVCGVAQAAGELCPQPTAAKSGQIFIKRVVAAPGDTIYLVGGAVVRNGATQRESFTTGGDPGTTCNFPTPIQVPAGKWFLMGDDRGASDDSRYWGPVPTAWIVGKVVK